MVTLTIRNIDSHTHRLLRLRAAEHGRSVEAEVRAMLQERLHPAGNWLVDLHHECKAVGGVELELPDRHEMPRDLPL